MGRINIHNIKLDDSELMELLKELNECKKVVIAGHVNPDGDAVGSCFAMALAMKKLGKEPIVLLENYSERYSFLEGKEFVVQENWESVEGDLFLAMDCASKDRLGKAAVVFDKIPKTVNIDHHMSNTFFADVNFVNEKSSSTCEVVYALLNIELNIDKPIASAIYTGMVFDTGGFRHASTTQDTYFIAGNLISLGIDFSDIQRRVLYSHKICEVKIFGTALEHLQIDYENKISYTYLSIDDMKRAEADYSDLDGIVEYILNLEGIEVSLLVSERESGVSKASLRSTHINVNKVAAVYGGGGHFNAAGATVEGNAEEAMEKVLIEIKKGLRENDK